MKKIILALLLLTILGCNEEKPENPADKCPTIDDKLRTAIIFADGHIEETYYFNINGKDVIVDQNTYDIHNTGDKYCN